MSQYIPIIVLTVINFYWVQRACISKNVSYDKRMPFYLLSIIPFIGSLTLFYILTKEDPRIEELEKRVSALEEREQ